MSSEPEALAAARTGDRAAFEQLVEPYRRELLAHCYRMSGSVHDAKDLLQQSLLKAWRGLSGFEGRVSVRTWLYKVTTSACLDAVDSRKTRALPAGFGRAAEPGAPMTPSPEGLWVEPAPDERMADTAHPPEARYSARESVALAFLAALQLLPAKQRAVLVLRDVLGWSAADCADLLQLTVPAVNSALQRARETVARGDRSRKERAAHLEDEAVKALLGSYAKAWESADVPGLVALLHDDAVLSMPPFEAWFKGPQAIGAALLGLALPPGAKGLYRLVPTRANGQPAFALYKKDEATGAFKANALHVVECGGGRILEITAFLEPKLFAGFSLGPTLS